MHVHHVPHAEHVEGSIRQNGEVWSRRRHAVLCLSCSQVSKRNNCLNGDVQVVSSHCYLVIFHPFVELLTVFYISGLVSGLPSFISLSPQPQYVAIVNRAS